MLGKNTNYNRDTVNAFILKEIIRRKPSDFTNKKIGEKIGKYDTQISAYFSGSLQPTDEILLKIAIAVGIRESEYKDIVVDAKIYEIEQTSGKKVTDNDIENVLRDEFGISDPDIQEKAISYIKYIAENKG